jgi:hypothetical protein
MRGLRWLALPVVLLPVAAALGATSFDGTYKGQSTALRGGPPICKDPGDVSWTVADGHFTVKWAAATLAPEVGADGSFRTSVQYTYGRTVSTATMTGRISNGVLEADIESNACKFHYSLKKS